MSNTPNGRDFNRYPMLLLAIYFACGIALGHSYAIKPIGVLLLATILIAVCLLRRGLTAFILPLIFLPLGLVCYEIESRSVAGDRLRRIYDERRIESGEPVEIEGMLVGFPDPGYDGSFLRVRVTRLRFKLAEAPASGDVRLFLPTDARSAGEIQALDLQHGSRVRVACRLEREERFLNPGVASAIQMLDQRGIDAVGVVKSPLLIEKLGDESVFLPLQWAYRSRLYLIESFRATFSAGTAGVMIASLLGNDNFLDRRTAETFREGGTFHVLVISGLHITFIGGLCLWMTAFITKRILIRSMLSAGFLWAYTFAVGAEIPVVRASLMFSFVLLAQVVYRKGSLLNALGACTLLILVWRPSDLFSPSFQLTFVSVAAIVGCSFPLIEKLRSIGTWYPSTDEPLPPDVSHFVRRLSEFLYWNEDVWRIENRRQIWSANLYKSPYLDWLRAPNFKIVLAYIFEGLLVSVLVQIWMLPLLVIYFHRLSPPGLVLNLWVGVFLALESFAAIAAIAIGSFSSWLAAPIIELTEFSNAVMISVPVLLSNLGVAGFRMPVYAGSFRLIYLLYFVILVITSVSLFQWDPFVLVGRRSGRRITIAGFVLTGIVGSVIVFHPFSAPSASGLLKIDFLDVGQGDSALVTFPDGKTMLIDGGGRPDFRADDAGEFQPDTSRIGERVVSEFLWEKGYSRIDYLVITHADADHIQGFTDVARNFGIGSILVGRLPEANPDFEELYSLARRDEVPVQVLGRGDTLNISGVEVSVLNPSIDNASRGSSNNASIVLRLIFGSRSLLLTGDIERETEAELVDAAAIHLEADVVKVPHHGSRTSSSKRFIEEVGADSAIISVGRRSRFGHPHEEVVTRWTDAGTEIFTTGERGTVSVETDGDQLRIRTFIP